MINLQVGTHQIMVMSVTIYTPTISIAVLTDLHILVFGMNIRTMIVMLSVYCAYYNLDWHLSVADDPCDKSVHFTYIFRVVLLIRICLSLKLIKMVIDNNWLWHMVIPFNCSNYILDIEFIARPT